jgi:DNA-binding GntR family transcriptional regulator
MIIGGELTPADRLTESDLAARLKVSRTPLREALNRLERDGLVTNRPRHGYSVAPLDVKTLEETLDVREVLEGYAARLAAVRITDADKRRLREIVSECDAMGAANERSIDDLAQELLLGLRVHRIIAAATGNAFLSDTLSKILDKCQHFVWFELLWLDEWEVAREEHREIVEAVCSGDGERAAMLAGAHVRGSRDNILRILKARNAHRAAVTKAGGQTPEMAPSA